MASEEIEKLYKELTTGPGAFAEPKEADIIINGQRLTFAQSMTLRVAIGSFLIELSDKKYMERLGETGVLYQARASEIQQLIFALKGH
jgi:hypothetical protein